MSTTTKDLVEKARYLRNAAPPQFDQFLLEFHKYTMDVNKSLIYATTNFQVVQGQVQQCLKLIEALEEVQRHG